MLKVIALSLSLLFMGCGNYENRKSPTEVKAQETNLDFQTIFNTVIKDNCIDCHTSPGKHSGYTEYAVVKQAAQEMLSRMKLPNPPKRMPGGGAPPLDDKLIAMFEEWVGAGAPEGSGVTSPEPSISFAEVKQRILKPYNCTACHSQYNDYSPVKKQLGAIFSQIDSKQMPFPRRPNQEVVPVTAEDRDFLLQWISQEAPEFPGQDPVVDMEEVQPEWISLRNNIFGPKCVLCHNHFGSRGPRSLATYKDVRDWFTRNPRLFNLDVSDENPGHGLLVESLERGPFDFESAMPLNSEFDDVTTKFEPLSVQEIDVIKQWIELKLPFDEGSL